MPIGGLTTGIDVSIVYFDPNTNGNISFGRITKFTRKQISKKLTSEALNGPPLFGTAYAGWNGTVDFERTGPNADNFFAMLEKNYFNQVSALNGFFLETTRENVGMTQWRYEGVDLDYSSAGDAIQGQYVKCSLSWRASRRVKA